MLYYITVWFYILYSVLDYYINYMPILKLYIIIYYILYYICFGTQAETFRVTKHILGSTLAPTGQP